MALEFLRKLKDKLLGAKSTDKPKAEGTHNGNARGHRPQGSRGNRPAKSTSAKEGDALRQPSRGAKGDGASRRPNRDSDGSPRGNRSPRGPRGGRSRNPRRSGDDPQRSLQRDGFSRRRERDEQGRAHALEHERYEEAVPAVPEQPAVPWDPALFQVEPEEGKKRFHDFDLPEEIMHAIFDLGFQYCTPIQAGSLANALAGQNVAGRAQTGTGKTAAYLVAILTRYLRSPDKRNGAPATPRALVIAPTRELCVQICRDAQALGKYTGLRSLAVFGGMDYAKQQRQLNDGPVDLVAATPGRLLDFQRSHVIDLSHVDTLVIDEADRMLDMGFIPDVTRIIRHLPTEGRQTLLYSATLNDEVMRLASRWMPDPVKVEIEPEHTTAETIEQRVYIVTHDQKFTILCHLLEKKRGQRVLVFANRRSSTERLAENLRRYGYECELLSGDVNQSHRMRVLDDFRSGKTTLVVATDVAGRGLDIADLDLVVNFELPYEAEDYVHRIGRTGRAGHIGVAVSFADDDESFVIPEIEEYMGEPMKCTQPEDELLVPLPRPPRRDRDDRRHGGRGERSPRGERRPRSERFAAEDRALEPPETAEAKADAPVASEPAPEVPEAEKCDSVVEAKAEPQPGQSAPEAIEEVSPVAEPAPVAIHGQTAPEAASEVIPADGAAPVEAGPVVAEEESPAVSAEAPVSAPASDSVDDLDAVAEKSVEKTNPEVESASKDVSRAEEKPVPDKVDAPVAEAGEQPSGKEADQAAHPRRAGRRPHGDRAPRGERRSRGEKPSQGEDKPTRAPRGDRAQKQPRGERGGHRSNGGRRGVDKPSQSARPHAAPGGQPHVFRPVVVPPGTHAQVWSPGE